MANVVENREGLWGEGCVVWFVEEYDGGRSKGSSDFALVVRVLELDSK